MMWKEMLKAAKFAKLAHEGQMRAGGKVPYYRHPMAVAASIWESTKHWAGNYSGRIELLQAAYLHDTLEDTAATLKDLETMFGEEVAELVSVMTRVKGTPHTDYYRKIKYHGSHARMLKMADRMHNNSELVNAPAELTNLREKAKKKTALMLKIFSE